MFGIHLAVAFDLTPVRALAQRKSFMAVARKIEKRDDRDQIAENFVAIAKEKRDAGMINPCAAWQKEVNRILGAE